MLLPSHSRTWKEQRQSVDVAQPADAPRHFQTCAIVARGNDGTEA